MLYQYIILGSKLLVLSQGQRAGALKIVYIFNPYG